MILTLIQRFRIWRSSAPLKSSVSLLEYDEFTVKPDEKIYTPNNKIQCIHCSTNIRSTLMCVCVSKVQSRGVESEGTGAPQKSQRVTEFLNQ
jgi:hypothetical protein